MPESNCSRPCLDVHTSSHDLCHAATGCHRCHRCRESQQQGPRLDLPLLTSGSLAYFRTWKVDLCDFPVQISVVISGAFQVHTWSDAHVMSCHAPSICAKSWVNDVKGSDDCRFTWTVVQEPWPPGHPRTLAAGPLCCGLAPHPGPRTWKRPFAPCVSAIRWTSNGHHRSSVASHCWWPALQRHYPHLPLAGWSYGRPKSLKLLCFTWPERGRHTGSSRLLKHVMWGIYIATE